MSAGLCLDAARRVCEVAAGGALLPGSTVVEVEVRGVSAVLAVRMNAGEVERRAAEGVAPLLDMSALDALLQLPAGLPVPELSLTPRERLRLRRCPHGAIEQGDGQLVRRLVSPLEVDVAATRTRRAGRTALMRAGRFGAYAASTVWLDGPAAGSELMVIEAGVYGLGVVRTVDGESPELLVAPRSSLRFGHTAAGWLFHEQVYEQLLGASQDLLPTP
ncbi:hypothetical protein GCM10009837_23280 [Streptomyces durmitorensis]|uniref:Uncharacterized protein n=1 Tax=Streptomyces durmitorensis TaxID=319947 RepID=A0ABY4PPF8_9ACTN|nr:hypothetical protein [Streptomyces durmitorensis]UQT55049.1 hypothetical protein M4V62_08040 [Streptomyces durmitorensis]